MYELPWQVAIPYEFSDGDTYRDPNYTAYEHFLRYFLQDTAVRTENPYEATLFYVPMLLYWYAGNTGPQHLQAAAVLRYVQQTWPFFNRSGACVFARPAW
ncbi:hypothetical protein TSOC_007161 [Tetrabaena socialis]|uniref:Uncharacterized protein n=1 Tax=Tetrabaena socialis TaxID=47790 RepID=A0A2J8A1Y7_9CHLO|nr:hypothetical protein TSOC_007161 [Tetrabaena socialis]|eukprot:PNH06508.1 hypothetical protein TSOC_007161 [Tetrabaena socialis]